MSSYLFMASLSVVCGHIQAAEAYLLEVMALAMFGDRPTGILWN